MHTIFPDMQGILASNKMDSSNHIDEKNLLNLCTVHLNPKPYEFQKQAHNKTNQTYNYLRYILFWHSILNLNCIFICIPATYISSSFPGNLLKQDWGRQWQPSWFTIQITKIIDVAISWLLRRYTTPTLLYYRININCYG